MRIFPGKLHTTIQLTVVTVFLLATTLTAAMAIGLQYYFGQSMAKQAAADLYTAASASITAELVNIGTVNVNVIDLLADNPLLVDPTRQPTQLQIFTKVLKRNPVYYGIYLGRSDGSFFEVVNLDTSEKARQALHALPTDRWLIIRLSKSGTGYIRHFQYLDEKLEARASRSEAADFEVTERPWYLAAMESESVARTEPYLFAQLGVPGLTLSKRIADTDTVVAIDMTMSSISEFLGEHTITQHSDTYLYNADGLVIASSRDLLYAKPKLPLPELVLTEQEKQYVSSLPTLRVSNEMNWPPFDYAQAGRPRGYSVEVISMIAEMTGIKVQFVNGYSREELAEQYRRGDIDLLHSLILTEQKKGLGLAGLSYASLPYALATTENRAQLTSLSQLDGKSLAIPVGWSIIPLVRSQFPDVKIIEAGSTLHALEMVLAGEAEAALDNEIIMRYIAAHYFLAGIQYHAEVGLDEGDVPDQLHIVMPADKPRLRVIVDKAIAALGPEQHQYLSDTWFSFDSELEVATSGTVPSKALVDLTTRPELHGQLFETRYAGETHLAYGAPAGRMNDNPLYVGILSPLASVVEPFLSKVKLSIAITAFFLFMLLPLAWLFARPIVLPVRQLSIENEKVRRREYDKVERVNSRVKELDELSESMVNMVSAIQAYEVAQRDLMDSIIKLIAQSIDDKSAYTGGHCERVPKLALMLAERASQSRQPAFQDLPLNTDDEWREFRIAAWLHDCGKINTPEHIVDKGSKLEVIYNRIHEVRMRFEVLWRDAEIDYLKQLPQATNDPGRLADELKKRQKGLQDNFAFVAQCNVGGENLDKVEQDRLRDIAKTTWQRYFSDRIGLSPVEELRNPVPDQELPVTEQLLSDKPIHIIERTQSTEYPPELGINMDIPEHLYNQGELYNLTISRGTLTDEDRFKINEHMVSTIKMLESLPFPDELKNVPRYASTHHETLKGSGYPRRLHGEKLSIPERILAVADIFEALTASDRPYKKAKPVSVAIDIMHRMVLDNHIDRDCFELFVREKVYLQYARAFLDPDQIDDVDAEKYLQARAANC